MASDLEHLLQANSEEEQYFLSLPKYVQEAAASHAEEIDTNNALHLFAEIFAQGDSYQGA
jgi:hypothetical protein